MNDYYIYKEGKLQPYVNEVEVDEPIKTVRKRRPEFRYECDPDLRKRFSETLNRLGLKRSKTMEKLMQRFIEDHEQT